MSGQVDLSVCQKGDLCELRNGDSHTFEGPNEGWFGKTHQYRSSAGSHRRDGTTHWDEKIPDWPYDIVRVTRDGVQISPAVEPNFRSVAAPPELFEAGAKVMRERAGSILKEKEGGEADRVRKAVQSWIGSFHEFPGQKDVRGRIRWKIGVRELGELQKLTGCQPSEPAPSPSPPEGVSSVEDTTIALLRDELAVWKKAMVEAGPHFGAYLTGDNSMEFVAAIPKQAALFAIRMNRQIMDVTGERDSLQAELDALRATLDEKHRMSPASDPMRHWLQEAVDLFEDRCGIGDHSEYAWITNAKAALAGKCVNCEKPTMRGNCANRECPLQSSIHPQNPIAPPPTAEELIDALREAEAGLECAGAGKKPPTDFVPSPTLALRAVRSVLSRVVKAVG